MDNRLGRAGLEDERCENKGHFFLMGKNRVLGKERRSKFRDW